METTRPERQAERPERARWRGATSRKLAERIVVEGTLQLQEPTHLGEGGEGDFVDMSLLVDTRDGGTPLLTGASVAGALRAHLRACDFGYRTPLPGPGSSQDDADERQGPAVTLLGGFPGDEKGAQSPLVVDDAYGQLPDAADGGVAVREGVSIKPETQTADEGQLFDLNAWVAGTEFPLRFELLVSAHEEAPARDDLMQALCTALEGLQRGDIPFGLRKRRGYGEATVEKWRVRRYDMTDRQDLLAWLMGGADELDETNEHVQATDDLWKALNVARSETDDHRTHFRLDAEFSLDGSLLIRSTPGAPSGGPDEVHLHALRPNGETEPVLSGTSLAGALRARALKIAQTLAARDETAQALVNGMFGFGPEEETPGAEEDDPAPHASRVETRETVIGGDPETHLVQQRVSIDRFTGGAYPGALFDQQPVFGGENTRVQVQLKHVKPGDRQGGDARCYSSALKGAGAAGVKPGDKQGGDARAETSAGVPFDAEIGLLLLLLKDLWTSDLPLGGERTIGRGRLKGKTAGLTLKDHGENQQWTITRNDERLEIEGASGDLEDYVTALNKHLQR